MSLSLPEFVGMTDTSNLNVLFNEIPLKSAACTEVFSVYLLRQTQHVYDIENDLKRTIIPICNARLGRMK